MPPPPPNTHTHTHIHRDLLLFRKRRGQTNSKRGNDYSYQQSRALDFEASVSTGPALSLSLTSISCGVVLTSQQVVVQCWTRSTPSCISGGALAGRETPEAAEEGEREPVPGATAQLQASLSGASLLARMLKTTAWSWRYTIMVVQRTEAVSYTHLTLPTNAEV